VPRKDDKKIIGDGSAGQEAVVVALIAVEILFIPIFHREKKIVTDSRK